MCRMRAPHLRQTPSIYRARIPEDFHAGMLTVDKRDVPSQSLTEAPLQHPAYRKIPPICTYMLQDCTLWHKGIFVTFMFYVLFFLLYFFILCHICNYNPSMA